MNLINENDPALQAARVMAERLGQQAGASSWSASRSTAPLAEAVNTFPPGHPTRLASILGHLAHRARMREEAADKLRFNDLMAG